MSIVARIRKIVAVDLDGVVAVAGNPERALDEYIRELRAHLNEARSAAAEAMAGETRAKAKYQSGTGAAASAQGGQATSPEPVSEGSTGSVDEFSLWLAQHEQVGELMSSLVLLEERIGSAEEKREALVAHSKRAENFQASRREVVEVAPEVPSENHDNQAGR